MASGIGVTSVECMRIKEPLSKPYLFEIVCNSIFSRGYQLSMCFRDQSSGKVESDSRNRFPTVFAMRFARRKVIPRSRENPPIDKDTHVLGTIRFIYIEFFRTVPNSGTC